MKASDASTVRHPVLTVENLVVELREKDGWTRVVDGVSLDLFPGEALGLVGESGSGKTMTALAIMGLVPRPQCRVSDGNIRLEGRDLLNLAEREWTAVRGREMAMIFQDPLRSLNPAYRVGDQVGEPIRRHQRRSKEDAWKQAIQLLGDVDIKSPERRAKDYPHMFSGGMNQRVMLAMALACGPKILIADEPTSALDVTVQAQILQLVDEMRSRLSLAVLLITHDLAVVAETCDRVAVMYAGQIVEEGPVLDVFERPRHPYTAGLLDAITSMLRGEERLETIPGLVPSPGGWPPGCRFHPRCKFMERGRCDVGTPALRGVESGRLTRCVRTEEIALTGIGQLPQADRADG